MSLVTLKVLLVSKGLTKQLQFPYQEPIQSGLKEIEEKDAIRNFQPPVSGELIMEIFNLSPSREVGIIKDAIKDAILDGEIHNDFDEAYNFMLKKAEELGLQKKNQ